MRYTIQELENKITRVLGLAKERGYQITAIEYKPEYSGLTLLVNDQYVYTGTKTELWNHLNTIEVLLWTLPVLPPEMLQYGK